MIKEFTINGYRRFDSLVLEDLTNINIIVGDNNVGKTTILEAIYFWACGYNMSPIISGPVARNRYSINNSPNSLIEEITACFNNKDDLKLSFIGKEHNSSKEFIHKVEFIDQERLTQTVPVDMNSVNEGIVKYPQISYANVAIIGKWSIKGSGDAEQTVQLTVPNILNSARPYKLAKYIDILSHINQSENIRIYADMKTAGLLDSEFIEQLQKMYTDIESIYNIPYMDATQGPISIKVKNRGNLPIYSFGDGLQRLYHILGSIKLYRDSVVCIDELDAGFHPSSQLDFCEQLINYSQRYNTQMFMTTHNIEFLDNFLAAAEKSSSLNTVRIITLKSDKKNKVITRILTGEDAVRSRKQFEMELR